VLYRKANGPKQFVIVDAGMNDLIHPATTNTSTRRHVIPNNAGQTNPRGDYLPANLQGFYRGEINRGSDCFGAVTAIQAIQVDSRPEIPIYSISSLYVTQKGEITLHLTGGSTIQGMSTGLEDGYANKLWCGISDGGFDAAITSTTWRSAEFAWDQRSVSITVTVSGSYIKAKNLRVST